MKKAWQNLATKYDALTLRERGIVALLIVVALLVLWSEVFVSALDRDQVIVNQNINSMHSQISSIKQQADAVVHAATVDPDKADQVKLARLQKKLNELDATLKEKLHGLISPTDMVKALEAVLVQQTGLRLLKVQSIKAEPLFAVQEDEAPGSQPTKPEAKVGIYKHGLQIEFSGSYLNTLQYLKALEALPWDFYWDGLTLDVEKYPKSKVVIKVHTISLDKDWIGV